MWVNFGGTYSTNNIQMHLCNMCTQVLLLQYNNIITLTNCTWCCLTDERISSNQTCTSDRDDGRGPVEQIIKLQLYKLSCQSY